METKIALVVDDSSLARMMVRKIFETHFRDWSLVEARDAGEALQRFEEMTLHLALVDFNMPGMNGLDLAEKMRGKHPGLPVHLVTANIQESMRERCEVAGIGFIEKPVDPGKLGVIMAGLAVTSYADRS
ncbi:MAG: response regulator [Magnetococcales bacterium]|nr:response regulator [Magnetococcales bacterium]MBF0157528.1 response regulator [Magnetococcales bacterium]